MLSSINQLAYLCNNHDSYLTPELIKQIDQLTHSYGYQFQCQKASLVKQVWKIIQNSQMFWQNTSLMLSQTQYDETRIQALAAIHNRIKKNWYFEDENTRNNIKNYLCGQGQKYSTGQMTKTKKIYFRKINQIIVEILKYQWMGDWYNFLSDICQSIEQSPALAQNYFDLLEVIFSQIFAEKERLTSEEAKRISEQIVTNYGKIQKAFEIYLVPECPSGILKNAMIALGSLIEWIPAYNVYFGFLIQKLIHLLANQQNQIETLNCLLTIVSLPNDQILSQFPAKAYEKRMQIFLGILSNDRLKKNETTSTKTLTTALQFLEEMQNHIQRFGKEAILPCKNSEENYIKITHKIQEWANENPAQKSEQFIIVLYRYIISIIKNEQDIQYLIGNVIQIAPCPHKSSFYQEQFIFRGLLGIEEQLELDRVNYLQLMKSLISNQEQQYFSYLNQCMNGDFTKPSKKKIRYLWKLIWNFYYFVSVSQEQDKLGKKVFIVVNTLIYQQQILQKTIEEKKNPPNQMLVCWSSFKLGALLILSNRRSRNKNLLKDPFLVSIVNGFSQNNTFVKGMVDILSISYDILPPAAKELIHDKYMSQMVNRLSRVQIDQRYIEMVAIWLISKKENMKMGFHMIEQILSYYKNSIVTITKGKMNPRNVQQAQQKQNNLLKQMRYLLKLCITVLPYLKSQLVFEMYEFTPIIKQFVVISDLSGGGQDQIQFFQLTMKLFVANFAQLSVDQVNKNLQLLVKENFEIINFIFEVLKKQAVGQEILQCMLNYLGFFILHFAKWDHSLQDKISKITKIITQIFQYNYTYEMPGFSEFIDKIVQCPLFSKLDGYVVSETLNKIFILASYQSEEKTLKAIQILKKVLGNSIDSTAGQSMLSNYILDFISSTYTIMIKIKNKEEQYIKEFSDVLFMSLIFVKSMKFKFVQDQTNSNFCQVYNLMTSLTRKIYPNYNEIFLSKVDKMLQFMLGLTNKQQFKEKSKDLVIVLMRGY